MARQHGLVTRQQAMGAGLDGDAVDTMVRHGTWAFVRRGVYAGVAFWESLDDEERHMLRDRAASLSAKKPHVMSHDSGARWLGLELLRSTPALTHLSRPGLVGTHVRGDIKTHLGPFHPLQVVDVDGVRVLDLARTAADIAREHGNPAGVVAMDSARRLGATVGDLARAIDPRMRNWPGVTLARDALTRSNGDSDSVLETLTGEVLEELGLGRVHRQFGLTRDGRTAWADFRVGRQLVECDGLVKYRRVEDGGLAVVAPEDVLAYEKLRQDWLCGFRLGMSRVVWSEAWGPGRQALLRRLHREISATHSLLGTSVDDLTPYLARGPRPRPRRRGRRKIGPFAA